MNTCNGLTLSGEPWIGSARYLGGLGAGYLTCLKADGTLFIVVVYSNEVNQRVGNEWRALYSLELALQGSLDVNLPS
jgi:hypothetical protein